jgi:hypothetical protein
VIKKEVPISGRDHYFLFGAKDYGTGTQPGARPNENIQYIKGIFVGQYDHGTFNAHWAGNDSVYFNLNCLNQLNPLRKFLILDLYNTLGMRIEYLENLPFIGFRNEAKIEAQ